MLKVILIKILKKILSNKNKPSIIWFDRGIFMKKNVNNNLRNIGKNFGKEKDLEENLKYEIAKEQAIPKKKDKK